MGGSGGSCDNGGGNGCGVHGGFGSKEDGFQGAHGSSAERPDGSLIGNLILRGRMGGEGFGERG